MKREYSGYLGYSQEFDVYGYFGLEDDGRFYYSEAHTSWGGGYGGSVNGTWRQNGDTLFLLAEQAERPFFPDFAVGQELQATVQGDVIDFGKSITLSLDRDEPVQTVKPPEAKEINKPVETVKPPEVVREKPSPITANFHFKNGRVEQRQLPNDPPFSLFTQSFYRLVDENGNETNFFQLRQESQNPDSSVVDFDEIEVTRTEETD
jgi:hypothetical protein